MFPPGSSVAYRRLRPQTVGIASISGPRAIPEIAISELLWSVSTGVVSLVITRKRKQFSKSISLLYSSVRYVSNNINEMFQYISTVCKH